MDESLFDAVRDGDLDTLNNADPAALRRTSPDSGYTPLTLAVALGDIEVIDCIAADRAALDIRDAHGDTALHIAARDDQPIAAGILAGRKASMTIADAEGRTAPEVAAASGTLRVLRAMEPHKPGDWSARLRAAARDAEEITAFLAGAALRAEHREALNLRRYDSVVRQTKALRAKLSAAGQAREEQNARVMTALPQIAHEDTGLNHFPKHRALSAALGPLLLDELEEKLHHHAAFLDAGGGAWLGGWKRWQSSTVQFGTYTGPAGTVGTRLELLARDLRQLVMSDLDLRAAHAPGVLAEGVDFSRSDLSAMLSVWGAYRGACFADAVLVRADFSQSDMRETDFRGADLTLTDFQDCDLRGADFRGAKLRGTLFKNARLDGAQGP